MSTYVDAKGAVRDWINAQATLVGPGNPLVKGAHLSRPKQISLSVTWCEIRLISSIQAGPAEVPQHRARISATFFGPTQNDVDEAATAYANLLRGLRGVPAVFNASTVCQCVDQGTITGPLEIPQRSGGAQAVVDADFQLRPTA